MGIMQKVMFGIAAIVIIALVSWMTATLLLWAINTLAGTALVLTWETWGASVLLFLFFGRGS